MRKKLTVLVIALTLTAIVLVGAAARSGDTIDELVDKLKSLSTRLRAQREQHGRKRQIARNRKAILTEEIEALKQRESGLTARRDSLGEELRNLEENLQELTSEIESMKRQRAEVGKLLREKAAVLANHIDAGLPLGIEARKELLKELTADGPMDGDDLKLLWHLYLQEHHRADEIEMSSRTVEVAGGAKIEGTVLRLGAVGAVFLSNDGRIAAVLVSSPKGYTWKRLGSYGELSQVRRAFEIAAGRRAPEIVNMPLDFGAAGGGK